MVLPIACINDPPYAGTDTYGVIINAPLALLSPPVTTNDGDIEGGITITSIPVQPMLGAMATISGSSIMYQPKAGYLGADSFSYTITDVGGLQATATVNIAVKLNNPPTAAFTMNPTAAHVGEPVTFVDTSHDPDEGDSAAAWAWDFGDGYTAATANPQHIFGVAGGVKVCLAVQDHYNAPSGPMCRSMAIQQPSGTPPGPPATPPTSAGPDAEAPSNLSAQQAVLHVDAGTDQLAKEGQVVVLHAAAPPEASLHWTQTAGPHVELVADATPSPHFRVPSVPGPVAVLYFEVQATMPTATAQDGIMISVQVDNAPTAKVVPDAIVSSTRGVLDGSQSSGDPSRPLSFKWTQWEGPAATIADPTAPTTAVALPDAGATYRFVLEVSDGRSSSIAVETLTTTAQAQAEPDRFAAAPPLAPGRLTPTQEGLDANDVPPLLILLFGIFLVGGIAAAIYTWRRSRREPPTLAPLQGAHHADDLPR
ncbi:MAG: PKD domain-containing protein [bacterium]